MSSSSRRWGGRVAAVAASLAVGGCIDSLNRWDSVTDSVGEAQAWNSTVQAVDPSPPAAHRVEIDGYGRRTANTMATYLAEGEAVSEGAAREGATAAVDAAAGLGAGVPNPSGE